MAEITAPRKKARRPVSAIVMPEAAAPAFDPAAFEVPSLDAAPLPANAVTAAAEPIDLELTASPAEPSLATVEAEIEEAAPARPEELPVYAETQIASAVAEPLPEGPATMATTFETTATQTSDKAKALFGEFNDRAKSAMEKSVKMGEELTEFTKGNVEALVTSGRVAAKGAEAMAQDVAETMKKQFESTTATFKSFASVKSPTELFQLQSDYAKSYFDGAVADASKFSESMMKLMGDIAQPLSSRYALAAEKFKTTTTL